MINKIHNFQLVDHTNGNTQQGNCKVSVLLYVINRIAD